MAIDFSLSPDLEDLRSRVRSFVDDVIKPTEQKIHEEKLQENDRRAYYRRAWSGCASRPGTPASGCRTCPPSTGCGQAPHHVLGQHEILGWAATGAGPCGVDGRVRASA